MTTATTQTYYDRFSRTYEKERHHGYHRLIDELELGLIRRYGEGRDVFEAGCGTGLLLHEARRFARASTGLDLSRGMLAGAQGRGLRVVQGSLTHLPLPSASVDLVYSMKVLAHVSPIREALAELARVVRPGGHLLLEFYNPYSLRRWAKRLAGPAPIVAGTTDHDVFTRYDTLAEARAYLPPDVEFVAAHGIRVFTPTSGVFRVPVLARAFAAAERFACNVSALAHVAGFMVIVGRKR